MAIGLSDPAEGMRQPTVVICANANNDFISGFLTGGGFAAGWTTLS